MITKADEPQPQINGMAVHHSVTFERICEAVEARRTSLDDPGFCILCGADAYAVEPDAEGYECEVCEAPGVYGAEELLIHLAPI